MRSLRAVLAFLPALLAAVAVASPEDSAPAGEQSTTATLVLLAQRLGGEPAPGARLALDGPGELRLRGNVARYSPWPSLQTPIVRSADAAWEVADVAPLAGLPKPQAGYAVTLLPTDPEQRTPEERQALVLRWQPRRLAAARPEARLTDASEPGPLLLSAFADPTREEVPSQSLLAESVADPKAKVSVQVQVRLVDERGRPIPSARVFFFELANDRGAVRVGRSLIAGPDGVVAATGLQEERYYRLEARASGGQEHAGPLLRLSAGEPVRVTMPLLPRGAQVGGFLTAANRPARGVTVATESSGGQVALSTTTDQFGWFHLGPLRPGEVTLVLREGRGGTPLRLRVDTRIQREVLVDLDALRN